MKRSDLNYLIWEILYDETENVYYSDNLLNEIIDKMVSEGYIKPTYTKETTFDDLTLFKTVEGWEPED